MYLCKVFTLRKTYSVSFLIKNSRYFTIKIYCQYLSFITTCYGRHGYLQAILSAQLIGKGSSVRKSKPSLCIHANCSSQVFIRQIPSYWANVWRYAQQDEQYKHLKSLFLWDLYPYYDLVLPKPLLDFISSFGSVRYI